MAVARRIAGPQDQYERIGAERLRDIRPFTTRLSEALRSQASGLVLAWQRQPPMPSRRCSTSPYRCRLSMRPGC